MTRREGPDAIPLQGGVEALNEPVPSASLTIVDVINGGNASLFTDEFLTTAAANPFTCDANGRFSVYVRPGTYSFTVPAGADAMENVSIGSLASSAGSGTSPAGIKSSNPTAGIGYGTGAGGAVTQITSSATGVTLNKVTGKITTVALTTAAGAEERFTVTDSAVAVGDVVVVATTYAGAGTPMLGVVAVTAGTFDVVITNLHASAALNALMVINFAVVKAVAA